MAFTAYDPADWIPGIEVDGTDVKFPVASVPELEASEVGSESEEGDIRKVWFALCQQMWAAWSLLPVADRPAMMSLSKSVSTDPATGAATHSFGARFTVAVSAQDVAAE